MRGPMSPDAASDDVMMRHQALLARQRALQQQLHGHPDGHQHHRHERRSRRKRDQLQSERERLEHVRGGLEGELARLLVLQRQGGERYDMQLTPDAPLGIEYEERYGAVRITAVHPHSPAAASGIPVGARVVAVAGEAVASAHDLRQGLAAARRDAAPSISLDVFANEGLSPAPAPAPRARPHTPSPARSRLSEVRPSREASSVRSEYFLSVASGLGVSPTGSTAAPLTRYLKNYAEPAEAEPSLPSPAARGRAVRAEPSGLLLPEPRADAPLGGARRIAPPRPLSSQKDEGAKGPPTPTAVRGVHAPLHPPAAVRPMSPPAARAKVATALFPATPKTPPGDPADMAAAAVDQARPLPVAAAPEPRLKATKRPTALYKLQDAPVGDFERRVAQQLDAMGDEVQRRIDTQTTRAKTSAAPGPTSGRAASARSRVTFVVPDESGHDDLVHEAPLTPRSLRGQRQRPRYSRPATRWERGPWVSPSKAWEHEAVPRRAPPAMPTPTPYDVRPVVSTPVDYDHSDTPIELVPDARRRRAHHPEPLFVSAGRAGSSPRSASHEAVPLAMAVQHQHQQQQQQQQPSPGSSPGRRSSEAREPTRDELIASGWLPVSEVENSPSQNSPSAVPPPSSQPPSQGQPPPPPPQLGEWKPTLAEGSARGGHRFEVGDAVECNLGAQGWGTGRVVATNWRHPTWPATRPSVPYQIQLEASRKLIFAPADDERVVRAHGGARRV